MNTNIDRLHAEQQFHDAQAAQRADSFNAGSAHLRFDDADYLDHETWIRFAFAKLGNLQGNTFSITAVVTAWRPSFLHGWGPTCSAFDLSPGYVAEAENRAAVNGVSVKCQVANGEELPTPMRHSMLFGATQSCITSIW